MIKHDSSANRNFKGKAKLFFLKHLQLLLILAACIFAIIVFLISFLGEQSNPWNTPLISIFSSVVAAFLCAASITFYEKRSKLEFDNTIEDKINEINDKLSLMPSGIQKTCEEDTFKKDFNLLYKESLNSTSILISGKDFFDKHKKSIISRFDKNTFTTKWFFMDPESEHLKMISAKTSRTQDELKDIINENVRFLKSSFENSKKMGTLEIYFMKLLPMQAIYIFDDVIVECKYFSSSEKLPSNHLIIYKNDGNPESLGYSFVDDSSRIEKESKCIFTSCYFENDKQFVNYLKGKMPYASEWGENNYEEIMFASAVKEDEKTVFMYFGCRYYDNQPEYDRNKKMILAQFKKKEEELRGCGDTTPLIFIAGIGRSPTHPRTVRKFRYKPNENEFVPIQSTNVLTRDKFDIPIN